MGAIPTLTGTGFLFPLQSGNAGKFLTTDGSVLSWGTPGGGGSVTGSGTTNYLSKWTSGTALGNSLVFDNGTNVGIGNISALSKLHVTGNILSYSEAANTAALFISANNSYNWQFGINNGSDYVITENGGVNGIGTIRLSMKPGGNLLVNTTTDQGQKFQVNGDALIGGLLTITGSSALPVQTATYIRFASGFSSPDIGRMYIGDGTGWKFHMSKRLSSTTTDLITFVDNGNVVIGTPGAFIDYKLEVMGATKVNGGELLVDSGSTIASNLYGTGQVVSGSSAQPTLYLNSTWNTTGNPSAIELNVTNTASGSSSKVMNLKVDLTSVFTVSKAGAIQTAPPTGYTAKPWKLGDATSGTITPDYYIKVEIDGQIYSIPALLGTP